MGVAGAPARGRSARGRSPDRRAPRAVASTSDTAIPAAIRVRNPRTGAFDYEFTPPSAQQLAAIAARLRAAQAAWSERPLSARIEVLRNWIGALQAARG